MCTSVSKVDVQAGVVGDGRDVKPEPQMSCQEAMRSDEEKGKLDVKLKLKVKLDVGARVGAEPRGGIPKEWKCKECDKGFPHKAALAAHKVSHSESLVCKSCGYAFKGKVYLKVHVDLERCGKTPGVVEQCKRCGMKFETSKDAKMQRYMCWRCICTKKTRRWSSASR
jgi:hypothetical protein